MSILAAIFGFVHTKLRRRATLALENLALRQGRTRPQGVVPTPG